MKAIQKRIVALTTVDNPFDPLNEFSEWYHFDTTELGYNSAQYLARKIDELQGDDEPENDDEFEKLKETAIDEIIDEDILKIYKKKVIFETA